MDSGVSVMISIAMKMSVAQARSALPLFDRLEQPAEKRIEVVIQKPASVVMRHAGADRFQ